MELTREEIEIKYDQNFQKFIDGLERLSKKYGIALSVVGGICAYDLEGFKEIKYTRDSSSGDILTRKVIAHDGEDLSY